MNSPASQASSTSGSSLAANTSTTSSTNCRRNSALVPGSILSLKKREGSSLPFYKEEPNCAKGGDNELRCPGRGVPAEGTTHAPRLSIAPCLQKIDAAKKEGLANANLAFVNRLGQQVLSVSAADPPPRQELLSPS